MKYFNLDKQEEKIIKDFDNDKFISVGKLKTEMVKYKKYAQTTLNKTKNINIRLSEKDLQKIKAKAIKQGIPYQTLIASLIHQYTDNTFVNNTN